MSKKYTHAIINTDQRIGRYVYPNTRNQKVELIQDSLNEYFFFYGSSWVDNVNIAQRAYTHYTGTGDIIDITIIEFI